MRRVLTAAVITPPALAAVFLLGPGPFFLVVLVTVELIAVELTSITRRRARGPLTAVYPLTALCGAALSWPVLSQRLPENPELIAVALGFALSAGAALLVLLARTPLDDVVAATGTIGFASLYLGIPLAALVRVQAADPWLLFLLLAIVWLGDTAAYYFGTHFGRTLLAPTVSPKKTWEGAVANLAVGVVAAIACCLWRLGGLDWLLVGVAALASIAGQLGDLIQSQFKRAAGVKDSGAFLPGHGGVWDRLDALLTAAPVWWIGLELLGRI
ncbi:MAG: phosphatidate cytidylyltransferase [Thermoanaerobaculia bacterium]